MTPLPTTFRKSGWDYKVISRDGDIAVLEQSKPGNDTKFFETVHVLRHNGYEIAGNKVAPAEHLPSSEQWGTLGFTYRDKESAFRKAEEMAFL